MVQMKFKGDQSAAFRSELRFRTLVSGPNEEYVASEIQQCPLGIVSLFLVAGGAGLTTYVLT